MVVSKMRLNKSVYIVCKKFMVLIRGIGPHCQVNQGTNKQNQSVEDAVTAE